MSPRAYTGWVIGGCLALLAPVVALNLVLIGNDYRHDKNRLASQWQQETRGVTFAPPITSNRAFKTLRANDRLAEINTLVFGSSTAMSITADAFPAGLRAYNFAQTGNPLPSVIGEAGYVVDHWSGQVRWLVIPLDWALGFVYEGNAPGPTDLSAAAVAPPAAPSVAAQLREALSLPRITHLAEILGEIADSTQPSGTARQFFVAPAGEPYPCIDGLTARDYDTTFRGQCVGFRFDGSATFADQKRITAARAPGVLAQAASASSQYARALANTAGQPDAGLLDHLGVLLRRARARGVRVVLFMPPLLPGLDARLAASAHSGASLARTKAVLQGWAQQQDIPLFDAGPSELHGCTATEFIDAHHALPDCYRKLLARMFVAHSVP
ncbi:MAG: hypothetical protein K2Y31_04080 [Burkholderiales bacterium]|nr:hypothetical protein [Burkholderiales bacterium]